MIRSLGLALYGPRAASHRVRLSQYIQGLSDNNISLDIQSLLDDTYIVNRFYNNPIAFVPIFRSAFQRINLLRQHKRYDVVIVHCELFPFLPWWLERYQLKLPFIYDFDDAFFLRYKIGKWKVFESLLGDKFDRLIRDAAAVTAGNRFLADYAKQFNKEVHLLPSVVDTNVYFPQRFSAEKRQTFNIGWVGSPSNEVYLKAIVRPLERLSIEADIRLIVVGGKAPKMDGVDIVELPWSSDTEVQIINSFDVGIMPIFGDDWGRGKCAYKIIQYMSCGVPVIASRVGANIDVVTPACGILVDTERAWFSAFRSLIHSPSQRLAMSKAARERAEAFYSLSKNLPIFVEVIKSVAQRL